MLSGLRVALGPRFRGVTETEVVAACAASAAPRGYWVPVFWRSASMRPATLPPLFWMTEATSER